MWWFYLSALVFALLAAAAGTSTLLGLPGIWLMVLLAVLEELFVSQWLGHPGGWVAWTSIGIGALIALVAEIVETAAGAAGARAGGASTWGIVGAVAGGIAGAALGTVFIPVPLVGTLAGAALGAALCAAALEIWRGGKSSRDSIKPALGAAGGRIAGTLLKCALAAGAWVVLVFGAFWR